MGLNLGASSSGKKVRSWMNTPPRPVFINVICCTCEFLVRSNAMTSTARRSTSSVSAAGKKDTMNVARAAKTVIADAPFRPVFARRRHFDLCAPHAAQMRADFGTTVSHLGQTRVSEDTLLNPTIQFSINRFEIEWSKARSSTILNQLQQDFRFG